MARLNATEITIKVSKLQKDNEDDVELLTSETIAQLETIIAELAGWWRGGWNKWVNSQLHALLRLIYPQSHYYLK